MKKLIHKTVIAASIGLLASSAFAAPVLVSQHPWGSDSDAQNMSAVFGNGNFINYTSFSSAGSDATSIFSGSNKFVMLEGGANTDTPLQSYLKSYSTLISGWVNNGGSLLIQSAGWDNDVSFNGVTLIQGNYNGCGTLSAAGTAAFSTASPQCGGFLAHDTVSGMNLTTFMTGNDNGLPIIAGQGVGAGYIMYSGLTASDFHQNGPSLSTSMISYTADQAGQVPEPASIALLAVGLFGIGALRSRSAK